jgi:glycosyltransferase involved in cell wall biosynthesis
LIIKAYSSVLPIRVIKGGLPSVGRNLGALSSKGDVLLFLDADAYFKDSKLILKSLLKIRQGDELVGCLLNIENNPWVRFLYFWSNLSIYLSKYDRPFVVGSYFMITKDAFIRCGGFDESLMHCEDYFLSKLVDRKKFSILKSYVYTDDRRFKKMGRFKIIKYFILNILNRNNKNYFKKDIGYWE